MREIRTSGTGRRKSSSSGKSRPSGLRESSSSGKNRPSGLRKSSFSGKDRPSGLRESSSSEKNRRVRQNISSGRKRTAGRTKASSAGITARLKSLLTPFVLVPGVIKWAAFAGICVLLASQLHVKKSSTTTFDTMMNIAKQAADLSNTDQGDSQMVRRLYGLMPSDYDGVLLYCPKTNMGAEELFLVRLKEPAQEGEVMSAINRRLETQLASFNGYGVDQTEMLEDSVTLSEGGYCLFYSGNDPQKVRNAVRNAL